MRMGRPIRVWDEIRIWYGTLLLLLAAVTYNQVQPLRINYLAS